MAMIQVKKISDLKCGDIVRHKGTHDRYVITGNYGDRAIAVESCVVSNPDEWLVYRPDLESRFDSFLECSGFDSLSEAEGLVRLRSTWDLHRKEFGDRGDPVGRDYDWTGTILKKFGLASASEVGHGG